MKWQNECLGEKVQVNRTGFGFGWVCRTVLYSRKAVG